MPATAALIETIAKLAAWRRGAARPRHRSRRGILGRHRRPARRRRTRDRRARHRPSAIRHAGAAAAHRHHARRGARARRNRRRTAARPSSRRSCGPPTRPTSGATLARAAACASTTRSRHVSVIAAANAEEEALAIAVALREALETPDKTAALVTPDRALARRVLAALARWNVAVDDSGGDALADTPAGVFARLVAEAALEGLEPVTLLALLKHPLLRLGAGAGAHAHAISVHRAGGAARPAAEARDRRPRACAHRRSATTSTKLHRADPRARLTPGQLQGAADLVEAFAAALKPLEALAKDKQPLAAACRRASSGHRRAVEGTPRRRRRLRRPRRHRARPARSRRSPTMRSDAVAVVGVGLSRPVPRHRRRKIRCAGPTGPGVRVRIYGLLEARLQSIDRVVLGGLVEGVWPPETRSDPWLSRPMRRALGLDLPERRISLSAHDFAQMLGAGEVVLAYPAKLSGAPTVPSRFIQRLAAVAGETRWDGGARRAANAISPGRASSTGPHAKPRPVPRPEPKPARDARPTSLSVTEIETWLRDPYSIYARHILRAAAARRRSTRRPARATAAPSSMARSAQFTTQFKDALPNDAVGELIKLGEEEFAVLEDFPEARAFWWPRFLRIARWFADFETRRRANVDRHQRGDRRQARDPARRPHLHAAHARRPHRASARRQLRDPRLQDRPAADRAAGVVRADAATDARRRDPARRTIRRHSGGRIDRRVPLRGAARRRARRRTDKPIDLRRQHARRQIRRGAARADQAGHEIRGRRATATCPRNGRCSCAAAAATTTTSRA